MLPTARSAPYACSGGSCCFYASCPWLGEAVMRGVNKGRAWLWVRSVSDLSPSTEQWSRYGIQALAHRLSHCRE